MIRTLTSTTATTLRTKRAFPSTAAARHHLSLLIILYADAAYKDERTALVDVMDYLDMTERRVRGHRQKRAYLETLIAQIMTMP